MDAAFAQPEIVSMATRTLLAAAYVISGVHRQPSHIEFKCERVTRLGAVIQFLIAITAKAVFSPEEVADIAHAAANQNRAAVLVAQVGNNGQLSWKEFLDAMGGAVPAWRVLTKNLDNISKRRRKMNCQRPWRANRGGYSKIWLPTEWSSVSAEG